MSLAPDPRSEPAADSARTRARIVVWWEHHRRELPWRASRDDYAIWVAEVMSVQTSVLRAVNVWERWMARWPRVEALAAASLAEVLVEWQGLGYPRRARDLHRGAAHVVAHGWPEDLQELPGVGPYIAAAIRCFAREEPVLPRDVNVNRVLARRFPNGVDITVDPWRSGQALMEFGQRVCRARPDCAACPVREACPGRLDPHGATAPPRRQKPYRGSLRERRGRLLARLLHAGALDLDGLDADEREAAATLVADGLARAQGARLHPPA
ncbi:MAG TPA: A/G-specific adenine glycosylase [Solirubrobacteraceae bacterium]|nr:A/G-specific adenine glycosylase [Solirubrobacteraceae bacterium]